MMAHYIFGQINISIYINEKIIIKFSCIHIILMLFESLYCTKLNGDILGIQSKYCITFTYIVVMCKVTLDATVTSRERRLNK